MLALVSGLGGVVLTALCAWALDARKARVRRDERDERDVWGAIDGLRHDMGANTESLAEIRGLLRGLFAEIIGDPSLVDTPHAEAMRERRRRARKDERA